MYRVLLVDDEPYAVEGLKTMFSWNDHNFSICGTAGDGKAALEYIRCINPDLVITDIKMPELDGLQLIQHATEIMKTNARFIILSGYDDFSYAQTALKYGVCDYLLKPLDINELNEVITKVIDEIKKKENIQKTTDKKLSYIVNNSVNRLLSGESKESIIKRLEFILNIHMSNGICCLLIEIDKPKPLNNLQHPKGSIRKIIEELLAGSSKINLFEDSKGRLCIIITEKMEAYKNIYAFSDTIKEKVYNNLSVSISISISNCANGIPSIIDIYNQASTAIQYKFYLGDSKIIYYKDIVNKEICYDLFIPEYSTLLDHIKGNKKEAITTSIDLIFNEFITKNVSQNIVCHYLLNLQAEILSIIKTNHNNCKNSMNELITQNMKMEYICIAELRERFVEFAYKASDYIAKQNESTVNIIEKVKELINKNYAKNIKLQTISENLSINPVYLGQLFKKTTGMYFNEYLHFIRIEEAKKLLRRTDMKISDISNSLGYNDSEYFVAKFKAFTTITPSKYKKNFAHP